MPRYASPSISTSLVRPQLVHLLAVSICHQVKCEPYLSLCKTASFKQSIVISVWTFLQKKRKKILGSSQTISTWVLKDWYHGTNQDFFDQHGACCSSASLNSVYAQVIRGFHCTFIALKPSLLNFESGFFGPNAHGKRISLTNILISTQPTITMWLLKVFWVSRR